MLSGSGTGFFRPCILSAYKTPKPKLVGWLGLECFPVSSSLLARPTAGRTAQEARSRTQFERRKANSTCWQTPSQNYAGWHAATVTSSGTTHEGTSTRALHLNKWKGGAGNQCMTLKFCPPYWNDGKRRWRWDRLLRWNFPCVVLTAFSAGS